LDEYATKVGSDYVVLTFTKEVLAGKDGKIPEFDWDGYRANLDQVVSTYSVVK
jgi:hypothetical protein